MSDRASADVDRRGGHHARAVGGDERGDLADLGQRDGAAEQRRLVERVPDLVAAGVVLGDRLRDAAAAQRDEPHAVLAELGGHLPAHRLERREGDLQAAELVAGWRIALAAESKDHAAALALHVPRGGSHGEERRPHRRRRPAPT